MSKVGKNANSAFRAVADQLSEVDEDGDETTLNNLVSFKHLLPSRTSSFFRYSGSFTMPGCEQIIVWTVFDNSITVSENQVEFLLILFISFFILFSEKMCVTAIEVSTIERKKWFYLGE